MTENPFNWASIQKAATWSGSSNGLDALFDARSRFADRAEPSDLTDLAWPRGALTCDAEELAQAYELRSGNDNRRKSSGAFYTPTAVARGLIDFAEPPTAPDRIIDPACGCGSFLIAAADWLVDSGFSKADIAERLHGVDIDSIAVRLCQGRLAERTGIATGWEDRVIVGDSLGAEPPLSGEFDLVVGNPPFGNAIESRTARSDKERAAYSERFPEAATGAYDRAGLFVEAGLRCLRPGGRLAFILPRAMLSAAYAERLRRFVATSYSLDGVQVFASSGHFASAAVFVTALVIRNAPGSSQVRIRDQNGDRSTQLPPPSSWAPVLSPYAAVLDAIREDWPTIGAHFTVQASAATGEAYELQPHLSESSEPGSWRLLTTGSIDPFETRWGSSSTRYLKRIYDTPWLPRHAVSPRRAELYDSPKVLVAGLSKVLEAVADPDGTYAGAVATIALRPNLDAPAGALTQLEIFLNSWLARAQFLAVHGAQALGGGSVQVTKKKLAALRFPPGLLEGDIARPSSGPKSLPERSVRAVSARPWDAAVLRLAWGADWIDSLDLPE